jgi:hypothetical protein
VWPAQTAGGIGEKPFDSDALAMLIQRPRNPNALEAL